MKKRCMGCMEVYDAQFNVCPKCGYVEGTPTREAYHMIPGSKLHERYVVGRVLGFGAFGITYIGYDVVLGNKVAIKEYMPGEFATRMPKEKHITVFSGEREEQFLEGMKKILDEARRLAKFQSVPNIVHIYDCFEENGTAYIVMEYLDGKSLKEVLFEREKLPLDEALNIVMSAIAGLKVVHKSGIIHRDIAPDNIFILKDGTVKLLDFGAARYATTKHSKSLTVLVKSGYSPEEQYRSRGDQGAWTDVYALAATLYKMVTGITPMDAMERSVKDQLKKPTKLGVEMPKSIETAIMNAMNIRIEDRTQSMEDFERELSADIVQERAATSRKKDLGQIPVWGKVLAGVGLAAAVTLTVLLVSGVIDFAPKIVDATMAEGKTYVPNMVNLNIEDAVQIAETYNLTVNRERFQYEFSSLFPSGRVLGQSLTQGTEADNGDEIAFTVSDGVKRVIVPTGISGRSYTDAKDALEKAGFQVELDMNSRSMAEDTSKVVLGLSIQEGKSAEQGSTITLVLGELVNESGDFDTTRITVIPDFLNMDEKDAEALAMDCKLRMSLSRDYSSDVEAGHIMSQSESVGASVAEGTIIQLTVSLGKERKIVPLVSGRNMTEADAVKALQDEGFEVAVEYAYDDDVREGDVISQTPAGNADEVEIGTVVTITVSRGEEPKTAETTAAPATRNSQSTQPIEQYQPQTQTQPFVPETPPPATENPAFDLF